jgi:hypothetical protein
VGNNTWYHPLLKGLHVIAFKSFVLEVFYTPECTVCFNKAEIMGVFEEFDFYV